MKAIAEAVMGQDGVKTFETRIKHGAFANICCLNLGNPHGAPLSSARCALTTISYLLYQSTIKLDQTLWL